MKYFDKWRRNANKLSDKEYEQFVQEINKANIALSDRDKLINKI